MREKLRQLLEPDVAISAKLVAISLFIGKMFERQDGRIVKLEERQLQKGDKGDQGVKGDRGPKGDKGDIGPVGKTGDVGPEGKAGKDGKKGKDGVSVVSSGIAADNHLVFTLSNGKIIDAGELDQLSDKIQAVYSTQVARDQITVSAVQPQSPQVNDLWLDIS
jgi:hypothetical protein